MQLEKAAGLSFASTGRPGWCMNSRFQGSDPALLRGSLSPAICTASIIPDDAETAAGDQTVQVEGFKA